MERRYRRIGLVVVGIGLTAATSCSGSSSNEDATPPSTTEPAAATVEDPQEVDGAADGSADQDDPPPPPLWVRADDSPLRPDQPATRFRDVAGPTAEGGKWLIVGSLFDFETSTDQPAVWEAEFPNRSNPWTRVDLDPGPDGDTTMAAVARSTGLDVAVGSRGRDADQRPAVWVRTGEDWQSIDPTQIPSDTRSWLSEVAMAPDGNSMVAIGWMTETGARRTPTIWLSEDGTRWEPVADLPFAGDGSDELGGVAVGPTGSVVTGWKESGLRSTAAAWWSEDGGMWREAEVEVPGDANKSSLGEVVWFQDRFVAVGGVAVDGIFQPASWSSTDGAVWTLETRDFEVDGGRSTTAGLGAVTVTVAGERLLASASQPFLQHVWSSTDGRRWSVVDTLWRLRPDGVDINSLAGTEEEIVVVGADAAVLYHRDGWRVTVTAPRVAPSPESRPFVSDVVGTGDGFVAVGGATVRTAQGSLADKALSWSSPDGVTWTEQGRFKFASLGPMDAVAAEEGRLAAVGTEILKSAIDRGRLGRAMLWHDDSSGEWLDTPVAALIADHRTGMESVALAGGETIAGGWIYVGDNIDAHLIDSGGPNPTAAVEIGHGGPDNELITAICARPSGEAVAFVHIGRAAGGTDFAPLVRSPDGRWTDATLAEGALSSTDQAVEDCAAGADGYLAAGWTVTGPDDDMSLWQSVDGNSWDRLPGPDGFTTDANQWFDSITAVGDGYLVAGVDAGSGQLRPVVWYGSGAEWAMVEVGEDTVGMRDLDIAVDGDTIVLTGRQNGSVRIYLAPLAGLLARLEGVEDGG